MRFPPQFLDELRARLPVSEVVGRRVRLKKAGREWKGLSPFNKERTPSFTVNDQKGFFHDFSSGKHGDIFRFVMETEGVTFPEAVERLASLAGLPVPRLSEGGQAQEQKRKTLHDVLESAAQFFQRILADRLGARGRGYLADRGIDAATQVRFRLGYAPAERFALKEHLGNAGVPVEDMIEAGLLISGDDISVPFDRFRDRIIFPITDLRGRVIAFGGRALEKDVPAKYLNSPETPLFHKGATLYNAFHARTAAHQGAPVIVVEGYIDVIAMVTAGYPATVAPLGTALTEDQLGHLWKMADEPTLLFDGDAAGRRAAYRAVDLALPRLAPGKSLRFAWLPEGQDPDDLVRSGGHETVAEVLAAAHPLAEVLWVRETEAGRFDTPERRAGLEARLASALAGIGHEAVRKYYRQEIESRLTAMFAPAVMDRRRDAAPGRGRPAGRYGGGRGSGDKGRRGVAEDFAVSSPRMSSSSIVRGSRIAMPPREGLILMTVINHPWLLESHAEDLADLELHNPDADRLRRAILDASMGRDGLATGDLRAALGNVGPILVRIETALSHGADWPARPGAAAGDVAQWWTHVISLHRKTRTLHKELREAERALGDEPSDENLAWLRDVQVRLAALEGSEASIDGFGALSGRPVRNL